MIHNEKYHTKSHIRRSNTQDRVFIAFIVLLMSLIFGGLLSGCYTNKDLRQDLIEYYSWDFYTVQKIKSGTIEIGFTKPQVKAAWGMPVDINSTMTSYGTSEQWVYGYGYHQDYVYFEGDTVSAIQN